MPPWPSFPATLGCGCPEMLSLSFGSTLTFTARVLSHSVIRCCLELSNWVLWYIARKKQCNAWKSAPELTGSAATGPALEMAPHRPASCAANCCADSPPAPGPGGSTHSGKRGGGRRARVALRGGRKGGGGVTLTRSAPHGLYGQYGRPASTSASHPSPHLLKGKGRPDEGGLVKGPCQEGQAGRQAGIWGGGGDMRCVQVGVQRLSACCAAHGIAGSAQVLGRGRVRGPEPRPARPCSPWAP